MSEEGNRQGEENVPDKNIVKIMKDNVGFEYTWRDVIKKCERLFGCTDTAIHRYHQISII